MVDAEKHVTVLQRWCEPMICPYFSLREKIYTNQVIISQEHEVHTDVADIASVWMETFRNHPFSLEV